MRAVFSFLWPFLQPSNLLFLMAVLGAVLIWAGRRHLGARLLQIAGGLLLAILLLPIHSIMLVTLETRFPHPELPEHVDGIITLGGSLNPVISARWGRPQFSERSERLLDAVLLAKRYPEARIVATGGSWRSSEPAEAEIAGDILAELGIPHWRLTLETEARNTYENAALSKALVHPRPDQTWILITSAFHMPRAVGVFRQQGWNVIPYPVDYYTDGEVKSFRIQGVSTRLAAFDFAARAWGALIAYRLMGATDELFPGPNAPASVSESE